MTDHHGRPTVWGRRALIVVLLICAILSFVTFTTANRARNIATRADRNTQTLTNLQTQSQAAVRGECTRLQQRRRLENANAFTNRRSTLSLASIVSQPSVLALLSPNERQQRLTDAATDRADAAQTLYEPPTDCQQALKNPAGYLPRTPTTFPANYQPLPCIQALKTSRLPPAYC